MTMEEMLDELEEYYECAGFENFYERVLKELSEESIREYYRSTFEQQEDPEREAWERSYLGKE